jgi:hypothetical protein
VNGDVPAGEERDEDMAASRLRTDDEAMVVGSSEGSLGTISPSSDLERGSSGCAQLGRRSTSSARETEPVGLTNFD